MTIHVDKGMELVALQTHTTTMKIGMVVHQEEENRSSSRSKTILGHTGKERFIPLQRHLFNHVHCCCIHNNQRLEKLGPLVNEWITVVWYI